MVSEGNREFWQHYRELVTFAFTVAAGAASLGGWDPSTARLVLRILAVASGVYLVFRLGRVHEISRIVDMKGRGMSRYLEAIVRVCDRQTPLYEEEVYLNLVIGTNDDEDEVIQEFSTKPTPQLVQRLVRPITPFHQKGRPQFADMSFRCEVEAGDDGDTRATILPIDMGKSPWRVWLIFEPAIAALTKWRLSYRPKGLWRPLRSEHRDTLVWNDRVGHDGNSPMTDFRVRFTFLDRNFRPRVVEQNNLGMSTPASRGPDGEWIIDWHDSNPRGHRYTWEIIRVDHSNN